MLMLERKPVEFRGKSYELVCNNAALAELEELYGGSMDAAMNDTVDHLGERLLQIMLNRAAKKCGDRPVSAEDVAEDFSRAMIQELDIFGMLIRALSPAAAYAALAETNTEESGEGN